MGRGTTLHRRLSTSFPNLKHTNSSRHLPFSGSWSTCLLGCNREPPSDVAHLQFKSRIAFKMVWCPPNFDQFVLVDDSGALLNKGKPTGELPYLGERQKNYMVSYMLTSMAIVRLSSILYSFIH